MNFLVVVSVISGFFDLSKSGVNGIRSVKEIRSFFTGQGIQGERTDQCALIENGSSRANEAPFEHLFDAVSIGYGVTNVKDLALVSHVGIVSVHFAVASEFINYVFSDGDGIVRKSQSGFTFILFTIIRFVLCVVSLFLPLKEKS